MTWAQWKALVATAYGTTAQNNAAFNRAAAAYTKGRICREVDRDIPLSRSYRDEYAGLRVALAGFANAQNHAAVLAAVNRLITVDAARPAIANFISDSVQHAMDELAAGNTLYLQLLLEAAIELQQQCVCLRDSQQTFIASGSLTTDGSLSRGDLPAGCQPFAMSILPYAAALAEEIAYNVGDRVESNDRIYEVVTAGTISTGELGDGLSSTTDDETETIDGVEFEYVMDVVDTPLGLVEWEKSRALSQIDPDACASHVWGVNPTVTEFFCHPIVDSDHRLLLEWSGVKRSFVDGDEVLFDQTCARAAAEYIRAQLSAKFEENAQQAKLAEERWMQGVRRVVGDCHARRAGT
jgi:hypothetical protein